VTEDEEGTVTSIVEKEKVVPTMCHGCHYGAYSCGVLAHVKDGIITRVEGNPYCPLNKGKLCAQGQSITQWVYNPQRLKYPLIRMGKKGEGKFRKATWDEALGLVTSKIEELKDKYGPECITFGKGQAAGWYNAHHLLQQRLLNALGSPNYCHWGTGVCYAPQGNMYLLTLGSGPWMYPKPDYDNADLIIEWMTSGMNATSRQGPDTISNNLRTLPKNIIDSLEKGAKLVVINPQLIPLAANGRASKWIPIRPGTDVALALAMINVVINEELYDKDFVAKYCYGFDKLREHIKKYTPEWAEPITDITAEEIRVLAKEYATTKRACLRITEGPQKRDISDLGRALPILYAITGHLDRTGGQVYAYAAVTPDFETRFADRISGEMRKRAIFQGKYPVTRSGGYSIEIIESIITGKPYKIRLIYLLGSNPMSTSRNPTGVAEALKKVDFLVVHEMFMTPTCRFADVVLPAASRFEYDTGPVVYENHLTTAPKVIEPLWDTRSELEVMLDLACRLGMGNDFWYGSCEDMFNEMLKVIGIGISYEELKRNALKGIYLTRPEIMDRRERYDALFHTLPHGKVQLYNLTFEKFGGMPMPTYVGPPEDPTNTPELLKDYPLIYTDQHSDYVQHHSWMKNVPWLREIIGNSFVKINPKTAERYGIKDGDWVQVVSPRGVKKAVARIFPGIRPDTLMGQHGWWQGCDKLHLPEYSTLDGGTNENVLYDWSERGRDPVIGDINKNTLVRIEKTSAPAEVVPIEEVV
jgi:anaerobic selenocysteine-containing dehydrogenase